MQIKTIYRHEDHDFWSLRFTWAEWEINPWEEPDFQYLRPSYEWNYLWPARGYLVEGTPGLSYLI